MTEFKKLADLDEAFRSVSAAISRTTNALKEIGEIARKLNRDLIRAGRRPALIHNGRKPR